MKGRIDVFPGEVMVTYEQIRDTFSEQERLPFAICYSDGLDGTYQKMEADLIAGGYDE